MTNFADLLAGSGIIVAPGAYDALSAKLAAKAGANAVYMTGFGVSGASFGLPDIGLVSAAEMSERVRAIAASCAPVPLIADGDNGHGGPLNAARLARAYEAAGAACIQIEDQVFPKRCGHMEGKEVVAMEEAAAKIRAAAEARESRDFKVMARTDARATHDLDEALRRGDHIAIDLLTGNTSPRIGRMLAVWGNLAVVAFASVLGWSAWHSIAFAYDFGSYSPGYLEVAMWIPKLPVLIGAVLLALTALTRILAPSRPDDTTTGPDMNATGSGVP